MQPRSQLSALERTVALHVELKTRDSPDTEIIDLSFDLSKLILGGLTETVDKPTKQAKTNTSDFIPSEKL